MLDLYQPMLMCFIDAFARCVCVMHVHNTQLHAPGCFVANRLVNHIIQGLRNLFFSSGDDDRGFHCIST